MSETLQLAIGIIIFCVVIWLVSNGVSKEPNLTDGSNCYISGNQTICN